MWISKNPPTGNRFWNINTWGYSTSQTSVLKVAFPWLASQTDPLVCPNSHLFITTWPSASPLLPSLPPHPTHALCGVVSIKQSMFQLIGKLASHMLSICFAFCDYQHVPDQIAFRWNAFGWVYPACLSRNIKAAAQSIAETCTTCRTASQSKGNFLQCIVLMFLNVQIYRPSDEAPRQRP